MLRERHDEAAFRVLPVRSDNEYLAYVLSVHRDDVRRYQPDFSWDGVPQQDRHPFLILRGDETVGVVIMRVADDVAHVELDYVTRRYRDFSPASSSGARAACCATSASPGWSRPRRWSTRTTSASVSVARASRTSWGCRRRDRQQRGPRRRPATRASPSAPVARTPRQAQPADGAAGT